MIKYRSSAILMLIVLLCMVFLTQCLNGEKDKSITVNNSQFASFAGSASCKNCHKSIYESHINTAHFHTSEPATEKRIMGSFDMAKNKFIYDNGDVVAMEKRADSFFQVAYINGIESRHQHFDMIIGSGTKGQSYATWANNILFQLPITYFTSAGEWSNSPGYPKKIAFNRLITSRCLECHTTYEELVSKPGAEPERFDKTRQILGVDCEKCHGAAGKHVEFQTQNPNEKTGKFIINPKNFTRQQSLDLCALCHGGRMQKTKPSFAFTAGEKLADYFLLDTVSKDPSSIDVHGNQYGLLKASKCFRLSNTLTCNTCHNSHENEKGKVAVYSQRCMTCHNDKHGNGVLCKMTASLGEAINNDCIKCHMPEQPSMAISVMLQGHQSPTPASMHTHLIKVYPEESKKIMEYIKKI